MALVPVAPLLSAAATDGFLITVDVDGNPAPPLTYYQFKVVYGVTTKYLDSSGNLQDSQIWLPLTSITVNNAISNTLYSVSLFAADNASGLNASSEGPSATINTLAYQPGVSLFSHISSTQIRANWTFNTNPSGTEYEAEITEDGTFLTGITSSGWVTTPGFDFTGLEAETIYYFRVRARNADLITTSFTVLGDQATLGSPEPVKVIRVFNLLTNRGFLVTWASNPEFNISEYRVMRSPSPTDNSSFEVVGTVAPSSTSFIDTVPFTFGITWYWKVVAVDDADNVSDLELTIPAHEQTFHSFEEQPFPTTISAANIVTNESPVGEIDTVNTVFTTVHPYRRNTLEVYLNGVLLRRGIDFTEGPGSQEITLTDAPDTGSFLIVNYYRF